MRTYTEMHFKAISSYSKGSGPGDGKEESSENEKHAPNCLHTSANSPPTQRQPLALEKQNFALPISLPSLPFLLVFPSSSPFSLDLVSGVVCSWELSPEKRPLG